LELLLEHKFIYDLTIAIIGGFIGFLFALLLNRWYDWSNARKIKHVIVVNLAKELCSLLYDFSHEDEDKKSNGNKRIGNIKINNRLICAASKYRKAVSEYKEKITQYILIEESSDTYPSFTGLPVLETIVSSDNINLFRNDTTILSNICDLYDAIRALNMFQQSYVQIRTSTVAVSEIERINELRNLYYKDVFAKAKKLFFDLLNLKLPLAVKCQICLFLEGSYNNGTYSTN